MAELIPNTIKLIIRATQEGSQRLYVLHYKTASPHNWSSTELNTVCADFWGACSGPLKSASSLTATFQSIEAVDIGHDPAASGIYGIVSGGVGTVTGEAIPANAACVISWLTAYIGRSYRGRTYLGMMSEAQTSGSTLTGSALTLALTVSAALLGFGSTEAPPLQLAIASGRLLASNVVTGVKVDQFVDSQRRRLLNRGA